jgi:NAD-reducing hydrogenase large subunit
MAVRIPPAAKKLRELAHCAQIVQSHALSFFYLSSPDLLLGMDANAASRNVLGVIASHPEMARDGIELRKFGLQIIEGLAQERVHPSWIVPGGVASPLSAAVRDRILSDLPSAKAIADRTLSFFKNALDNYKEEIESFGSAPTMYAGLVDRTGTLQFYEGDLRFRSPNGGIVEDGIAADEYLDWIGEASLRDSYLKAPYFKPQGFPEGAYRVGPLARMNAADRCGTPQADAEFVEFHKRFGFPAHSAFLYHYARLIEIVYALEKIEALLADSQILEKHVRATGGVNSLEGVGMIEAPRGILIHHYRVNEEGGITWANLIVATGHNNLAIGRSVQQVSERFIDGNQLKEGMLNRVSAVVRAYDPCLSCSTHALGEIAFRIQLLDAHGELQDEIRTT